MTTAMAASSGRLVPGVVVVAAAVLMVLVDVSTAKTTYTVSVLSATAQDCTVDPGTTHVWQNPEEARQLDDDFAFVNIDQSDESEGLVCSDFGLTQPLSAAWSSVPVTEYDLGARVQFDSTADLHISLIDNAGTESADLEAIVDTTSGWEDVRVGPATYSGVSMMVGDLASSQIGMKLIAQTNDVSFIRLDVDNMYMEAIFSVEADATDVSPASAKQGDTITVTGTFFDLREFGRSVTCLFNDTTTHETHRVDIAGLTSSAVTCVVPTSFPETGEGRDVRVSVGLDSTHDIDSTHVFTMFDEADGEKDKPQFPLETVLYAGGAGLAVLLVGAAIMMRRSSSHRSVAARIDKSEPRLSASLSGVSSASVGRSGTSGRVGTLSDDASQISERSRSRSTRGGKGTGKASRKRKHSAGKQHHTQQAPPSDRVSLMTEVPEPSYEAIPIAEFYETRQSTYTLHSVQSEQAPHFVEDP